jgi:sulfur carrier protein
LILNNLIMAKIQLNGKKVVIKSNYSILDLLKKYKLSNKRIAIEHNGTIIQKVNYRKKYLKNNDKVEIVHFIGGG